MDIIAMAFRLSDVVAAFAQRSRRFFYAVMLMCNDCPGCGGALEMIAEGRCQCRACGGMFDPTITFQQCSSCGGKPELRVRRYQCRQCGLDMPSRFLFDGIVFNAEYFRQKMVEHRKQKNDQKERVRQMLAKCRSLPLDVSSAVDLQSVPGLLDALDAMTSEASKHLAVEERDTFDLKEYQKSVQSHLAEFPISLDDIPSLIEDTRLDRIWRFIAIIFLAHARVIDAWQEGPAIMVIKHEAH